MLTWQKRAEDLLLTLNIEMPPEQAEPFFHPARLKVVAGGEGSGKSFIGALYGLARALDKAAELGYRGQQLVWIMGADYEDARKEFEYLVGNEDGDWLRRLGLFDASASSYPTSKDQKCIARTHARYGDIVFETISAYDPKKVGREQPDGIIGCEVSRWEKETWDRAYGRLQRKRGWGIFTGSFESSLGWFPEVWDLGQNANPLDIRSFSMPTWVNRTLYPGGEADPAIEQLRLQTTEMRFLERYGGRPSPPRDSVMSEFRSLLHVDEGVALQSQLPVHLFIDPGDRAYAVLFVQFVEDEVWVVDEVYVSRWTHEQVVQACQLKPAWAKVDAFNCVMDVAGKQQHMGMGSAAAGWYEDTGIGFRTARWAVSDQLDKLRSVLAINPRTGRPYLRISPHVKGLIAEMGGGSSPVEGLGRWKMKGATPETANDHACKALAYGLLTLYGARRPARAPLTGAPDEEEAGASYLQRRLGGGQRVFSYRGR